MFLTGPTSVVFAVLHGSSIGRPDAVPETSVEAICLAQADVATRNNGSATACLSCIQPPFL
jgi:hypothetical protein